jgi:hypothetical protein
MHPHSQNCTSNGCGSAYLQPHANIHAAEVFPAPRRGRNAFSKQSGFDIYLCSHHNSPPPPCYTQFTIVTCCCFFKERTVCEGRKPLSLPYPTSCELEDTSHSQQLHRDSDCSALRLQPPPPAGEIGFPSWSSGIHIYADTGACKPCCCTRSHLGKRMFLAARRKLARFGLRRRRSVNFQSTSPVGYFPSEAESSMSCELPASEAVHPSRELFAELSCEKYVPQEPIETLEPSVRANSLSTHLAPSILPAPRPPIFQPSISPLSSVFSGFRYPSSASDSENPSPERPFEETKNECLTNLGHEGDAADHIRSFSEDLEYGPPSEATAENSDFFSRQASYASNGCTPETSVDLYLDNQPSHGLSDLQLSSPSNQHSVPSESNSCDCLCLQTLNFDRRPSPSELIEILHSQSEKFEGLMPPGLLEHMGSVFEFTTDQLLQRLNDVKETEFHVVKPVVRIKITLDTGFSALKSLVVGQVPDRLDRVISLLFVASSIVRMLVDEQSQAQFLEASFLDAIEWMNAIKCRDEQDAFKILLQYVWLPATLSPVCTHCHRWSGGGGRSSRPTRTPFERISTRFEEGRLGWESESSFRLRNGVNAKICRWFIDCECIT